VLLLGHIGITYGVALAADTAIRHRRYGTCRPAGFVARVRSSIASFTQHVDLRLLMVASLLPDIIDKPLGMLLLANVYGTGRLFCHALIFPVLLALAGLVQWHARSMRNLLILAYGSGLHLILDGMWRTSEVLFWPLTRMPMQAVSPEGWLEGLLRELVTNPAAYIPEIAGGIILLPLVCLILRGTGPVRFLRSGTMELH